nr:response regulator [Bacteroidota bacterium]
MSSPKIGRADIQKPHLQDESSSALLSPLEGGQRGVSISISDTGPGIPPEKLPYIFDRFYQADDTLSREQEGTGIGLAIVKEMVNLHHGHVTVNSKPGEGTAFIISLPIGKRHLKPDEIVETEKTEPKQLNPEGQALNSTKQDSPEMSGQAASLNFEPGIPDNPNVTSELQHATQKDVPVLLIVEDNPDMRSFIREFFQDYYQIIESGNGEDGLKRAIQYIPDIIISDVMMPKMDGNTLCQKLKTDEKTCHIPVILLTARASKESRLEGLETGADDFITKPFEGEELQLRVKNLIHQRRRLGEHYRRNFELDRENIKDKVLSMDEKFLQKAKAVAHKNLSNPEYGLEDFASDMALSRFQLHRKLSALINQSITEFIRTIRLNYAIVLLKNRAGSISEIAYDAGFNTASYFSISFKKHFGLSPTEYLNQLDQEG